MQPSIPLLRALTRLRQREGARTLPKAEQTPIEIRDILLARGDARAPAN